MPSSHSAIAHSLASPFYCLAGFGGSGSIGAPSLISRPLSLPSTPQAVAQYPVLGRVGAESCGGGAQELSGSRNIGDGACGQPGGWWSAALALWLGSGCFVFEAAMRSITRLVIVAVKLERAFRTASPMRRCMTFFKLSATPVWCRAPPRQPRHIRCTTGANGRALGTAAPLR